MNSMRKRERPALPDLTSAQSPQAAAKPRKLRVLVAGEFSAGKTSLINGLLGEKVLPSHVTATALPPIWLVHGRDRGQIWIDKEEVARPLCDLAQLNLEKACYCVIAHGAPILERIDIIDTPGSSDPNMPMESWQRMLRYADLVIWCTNATQAWRQSEKAVWDAMPQALLEQPMLVVTHGDRLPDERTRARLMRRVQREAGEVFPTIRLAALTDAQDVAQIGREIERLSGQIGQPSGETNETVAKFVRERDVIAFPKPRMPVKPRRLRSARLIKAEGAELPEVTDAEPLILDAPLPDYPPAEPASMPGPARALWEELTAGHAFTDAADVLAHVEHLLDRLDARAADEPEPAYATRRSTP
ncbi:hypothetical protein B6V72_01025 [Thioclava sp. F34-6]|uniref:dynamin family protein n=1 Tax=Thioclava sp. F34-6 TaxID=1973003 RepID=UPI000B541D8D|nr:dynamin family protein [Thioclava sp. F34-6]OWY15214.1 hypothetical protein B6V72_01025 [Thioclava sp. F34-6]